MELCHSHIFSNFIVDNQLNITSYGTSEKAYHKVYRRRGKGSQGTSEVKANQQDITWTDRGPSSAGCSTLRPNPSVRYHWKEIGDIPEHSPNRRKAVFTRRGLRGADAQEESQFGYLKDQGGRASRGTDPEDRLWPGSGRAGQMDAAATGGAVQGGAGRTCEQGHHPQIIKKNKLRPHKNTYWCIPAVGSGEFVACMEDILDVYERPYDPGRPVVCVDELPYEMHGEAREPLPAKGGSDEKKDFEYVRCGTCSVFGAIEPLTGRCMVAAKERRTKTDLADFIRQVASGYADAEKIILVWDNLNTHKMGSLYEAFSAAEAHDLASRFEIHYTPKHGSWLNVAEILLNILTKQCLKRRLDSIEKVKAEIDRWVQVRNNENKKVDWQFKTSDARIKLKRLYPEINILNH